MTGRTLARMLQSQRAGRVAASRTLLSGRSDISGGCPGRFSGASDGFRPDALAGAMIYPAKPSKLKGIAGKAVFFRGLARMLLNNLSKEATALKQATRGDAQMPANVQLTT
ncbi:hypothetical protein BD122_28156 [Bradyrhizobium diazoefficiens]|nr:hypothetical protein BD122_28156 [Bradyrhizobium diazoefficiens]